jgi:hypothetical protein
MTDSTSGRTTSPLPSWDLDPIVVTKPSEQPPVTIESVKAAYDKIFPPKKLIVGPAMAEAIAARGEEMPPNVELVVSEFLPEGTAWLYTPPDGIEP